MSKIADLPSTHALKIALERARRVVDPLVVDGRSASEGLQSALAALPKEVGTEDERIRLAAIVRTLEEAQSSARHIVAPFVAEMR